MLMISQYLPLIHFIVLANVCARGSFFFFTPEAILLIGCQDLLGCGCVGKLFSVNTAPRAHDWAGFIHTHTDLIGSKACQGLVVVGWKHPFTCCPPPSPPTAKASQIQTDMSGDSVRCAITPNPSNHCHSLSSTSPPPGSKLQDARP